MAEKLSWKAALFWIFGSVIVFSGTGYGVYFYFLSPHRVQKEEERFSINAIVQTGPEKEALKTAYLAELMELSCDKGQNLFTFDVKKAEEKLLLSPLIKRARVRRIRPGSLYVDYEVRHPVAILHDYENMGIDQEGYLLPLHPFFPTQGMPEIYLGLFPAASEEKSAGWPNPLKGREFSLSLQLLQYLSVPEFARIFSVKRIDVSKAYSKSIGKREIVLWVEEAVRMAHKKGESLCVFPQFLRLNAKDFEQEISNFIVLREKMLKDYQKQLATQIITTPIVTFSPRIIDFRIPELAFIQEK